MKKYHIGYIQGTFDMFHIGHLRLIQRAAKHCESLIVGVVSDEFNLSVKRRLPCIPYEDRAAIVASIGVVDDVVRVEKGQSVIDTWRKISYNVYFSGDDHVGAGFTRDMEEHGINVVFFPYTRKISSTMLREQIGNEEKEPYKKTILFLPYKASMWDSFESVWEAARNDSNCRTLVMPIPYAVLNDDGSIKEWQCEIDKFPPYVPVMNWQEYDIAKHHHDIIYIHNPYDDNNRLTRVESCFYSRNLRRFTDMLVYIPYFAWTGLWPPSHLGLPCYEHVDKIIVQSSNYQVINDKFFEEDNATLQDVMPVGSLVSLGSPKIDKMLKVNSCYKLPDDWISKLGRHKTVLYNTTVSPLMIFGKRGINKMWQVYHAMEEAVDMTFIWRPHPLLESMLKVQHPELLSAYSEWKKSMLNLSNVIYDDTSDLERTIALSDGYIGESGSSVAQLFALLGKPIFYNDMYIGASDGESEYKLAASGLCIEGERAFFWAHYWNALCEADLTSGTVKVLYSCQTPVLAVEYYIRPIKCGSHVVLVPGCAQVILDYDLSTGEINEITYEHPLAAENFNYALVWRDKVIMPGFKYNKIIMYNVNFKTIETLLETPTNILKNRTEGHTVLLGKACIVDDILYVPVTNANQVLAVNMADKSYKIHYVGEKDARYGYAVAYAGNIWLAPFLGGPIVVWNPPTGVMRIFDEFPKDFQYENVVGIDETYFFNDGIICGKYWWLLPKCAHNVLRVDLESGTIDAVDLGINLIESNKLNYMEIQKVWCGTVADGKVYIWASSNRKIYCLDNDTGKLLKVFSFNLSTETAEEYRHELGKDDFKFFKLGDRIPAVYEDGISRTHKAFLQYIRKGEHNYLELRRYFEQLSANCDGTCGQKIHEYIIKELARKNGDDSN